MGSPKATAAAALALALSAASGCCLQTPCPPSPKPKPGPPSSRGKCPVDALKLGACADVLDGLLNVTVGKPPKEPCCSLIQNLADLEAAACLCTAIKANLLGINLNIPVDLSLLLNYCGKEAPTGFRCPWLAR